MYYILKRFHGFFFFLPSEEDLYGGEEESPNDAQAAPLENSPRELIRGSRAESVVQVLSESMHSKSIEVLLKDT